MRIEMIDKFVNKIHQGNSLDILKQMPDSSVDTVITSPPYWQLRDYGYNDQWGLEPTYQEYLEHLWSLMDEIYRILKPTGTTWINLGDTYGSFRGYSTASSFDRKKGLHNVPRHKMDKRPDKGSTEKCLLLIPHRFAIGCIDRNWIVRNDCIWAKRNSMPESVTDRFSKKHEYFFFMVKQQKYYFDLDGIRDRHSESTVKRFERGYNGNEERDYISGPQNHMSKFMGNKEAKQKALELGKNPGSVSDFWDINNKGSSEKHYASFNFELIEKPIVAGCPESVCKKCGKPREKIIKSLGTGISYSKKSNYSRQIPDTSVRHSKEKLSAKKEILGLTDCGCGEGFEGGIVMDMFCGTGTTLVRALQLGRRVIGIDGSKEYCDISRRRINKELNQLKIFA